MDIAIHRPRTACARSGRQFVAGEPFFSALVRSQGSLERLDFADTAWSGPPDNTLAWWFTDAVLHPKPNPNAKPPKPVTMAQLPGECRAVLNAK